VCRATRAGWGRKQNGQRRKALVQVQRIVAAAAARKFDHHVSSSALEAATAAVAAGAAAAAAAGEGASSCRNVQRLPAPHDPLAAQYRHGFVRYREGRAWS
jgi:sugar (pentulose or hexulose) kinase